MPVSVTDPGRVATWPWQVLAHACLDVHDLRRIIRIRLCLSRHGVLLSWDLDRFSDVLLDEWVYARPCRSEAERREAFPRWLYDGDHHRGHTALKGLAPREPLTQPTGQYTGWGSALVSRR